MRTLRYFPDGEKNCYSFAIDVIMKYLVRARFYYGNYDGLSNPPTFDVSVNGFKWMTVVTSLNQESVVIEGIFSPSSDMMHVCLARADGGGIPFISSLEIVPLPYNIYEEIDLHSAFLLNRRINFGAKGDVRYYRNYTGDSYNRIWKAYGSPDYCNNSSPPLHGGYFPNEIPKLVLLDAIEPLPPSNLIVASQNLNQMQKPLCDTVLPGATLPPILNAMEVYTVIG